MNLVIGLVDTAADVLEIGAGIISNLFFRDDTAIDFHSAVGSVVQLFKRGFRLSAISSSRSVLA